MKRNLPLTFAFLAIVFLNINAQDNSATALDSIENEIIGILNDKTWHYYHLENGGRINILDLKEEITVSNHRLNFRTKKEIKFVNMTNGKIMLGEQTGSPEIILYLVADSVIISKKITGSGSSGSAVNRAEIESNNHKVKNLHSLFKTYQSYPQTEIYKKDLKAFEALADDYGKAAEKHTMTEEQRRLIVQANALNDKHSYSGALEKYKQATALNPVSYPQAYYNMALIAAQLEDFYYAIFNMRKYLLLAPNADDSRAAQDKIYEWEAEIE